MRKLLFALALLVTTNASHALVMNSFTGPSTALVGEEITATFTYDFLSNIGLPPGFGLTSFSGSGNVNWGDGFMTPFLLAPSGMEMFTHTFMMAGMYTVLLQGTFTAFFESKPIPCMESYEVKCEQPQNIGVEGRFGPYSFDINVQEKSVPEAGTLGLLTLGLIGIGVVRRRG